MSIYDVNDFASAIGGNPYPGRGIIAGLSPDGKNSVVAYFIMGRSSNSRNRLMVQTDDGCTIRAFDESKVEDPSLIMYDPVKRYKNRLIVSNGDQTTTIYNLARQRSRDELASHTATATKFQSRRVKNVDELFETALSTREFEPDAPNFTPRISAMVTFDRNSSFTYKLSILKSANAEGTVCSRYYYNYEPEAGVGHMIHTYSGDGNPLPTYTGEPVRVAIGDDLESFADEIWSGLNEENKVALYVKYTELGTGIEQVKIINKLG